MSLPNVCFASRCIGSITLNRRICTDSAGQSFELMGVNLTSPSHLKGHKKIARRSMCYSRTRLRCLKQSNPALILLFQLIRSVRWSSAANTNNFQSFVRPNFLLHVHATPLTWCNAPHDLHVVGVASLHMVAYDGTSHKEGYYLCTGRSLFYDGSSMSDFPIYLCFRSFWLTISAIIINDQLYFEGGIYTFDDGKIASQGTSNSVSCSQC